MSIEPLASRRASLAINIVGGIAVLGSYAWCMTSYPAAVSEFWGGVPDALRPVYTLNMLLAAAGYFAFSFYLLYRLEASGPGSAPISRGSFNALYALILFPSALWMPLTFAMLQTPSDELWIAIRSALTLVGIGSLGLLAGLVIVRPASPSLAHKLAVLGSIAFCLQTAVLDALVWPAYFPA